MTVWSGVLKDESFARNLCGLLVLSLIVFTGLAPSPALLTDLSAHDMALVQGQGWGQALVVTGVLLAAVSLAAVATGGTIAIAAAFGGPSVFGLVAVGMEAVNVGMWLGGAATAMTAVGQWAQGR